MAHAKLMIAVDPDLMLTQQVIVLMDATRERILDRHDAAGDAPALDRGEDAFEVDEGARLRALAVDLAKGRLAIGARLALVSNCRHLKSLASFETSSTPTKGFRQTGYGSHLAS